MLILRSSFSVITFRCQINVTYAAYDALGDTKYMNFVLVLFLF